jgi:hypothetical protein
LLKLGCGVARHGGQDAAEAWCALAGFVAAQRVTGASPALNGQDIRTH